MARPEGEPIKVISTDPHSVEYHMNLTSRLFRAAGLAQLSEVMLMRHMGGVPGTVEMAVDDYASKTKHKVKVHLTPNYVWQLKLIAYRAYLALWDIKPEGPEIARQVMDNLQGIDRSPTLIEDHLDDLSTTATNGLEPGGPVD